MSFGKLIVLALVIVAVWYGFRLLGRRQRPLGKEKGKARVNERSGDPRVVDLERNPKTGAYEPRRRDD